MKALLILALLIIASNCFAEDMRYYDVEIVIFENTAESAELTEKWPLEVNLNKTVNTQTLGEPVDSEWLPIDADPRLSYHLLNPEDYKLTSESERIAASNSRRLLLHTAWRQPGLDKKAALPVYFRHEVSENLYLQNINTTTPNMVDVDEPALTNSEFIDSDSIPSRLALEEIKPMPPVLEGILRVTLSRYLHLETELTYRKNTPEPATEDNAITYDGNTTTELAKQGVIYHKQIRNRIRSNELHYLDHPVLGVLVLITQYEKPELDESITDTENLIPKT